MRNVSFEQKSRGMMQVEPAPVNSIMHNKVHLRLGWVVDIEVEALIRGNKAGKY